MLLSMEENYSKFVTFSISSLLISTGFQRFQRGLSPSQSIEG